MANLSIKMVNYDKKRQRMLIFSSAMNTLVTLLQGTKYYMLLMLVPTCLHKQTSKTKQFLVCVHVGVLYT